MNNNQKQDQLDFLASLKAGLMAGAPILLGLIPFGLIYGLTASEVKLSLGQTAGMSLLMFAGSSQLVFLDLWSNNSSFAILILTCLVVNLRLLMYSASLKIYIGKLNKIEKITTAYYLTDESYALSLRRLMNPGKIKVKAFPYFLGAALPTWTGWQISGLLGYLSGSLLPSHWPLDFAVPLTFLALLLPLVITSSKLIAALSAALIALIFQNMPHKLNIMIAVIFGCLSGFMWDKFFKKR